MKKQSLTLLILLLFFISTSAAANPENMADAIATPSTQDLIQDANSKSGSDMQSAVYNQPLQNFPTNGNSYVVLSTGNASDINGTATTTRSADANGGTSATTGQYSQRGNPSNDIVNLNLQILIPKNAKTLSFNWRFATEENPTFYSGFRDWAKVIFTSGSYSKNILLLPNGNPVDAYNAAPYSNAVTGITDSPLPPYANPNDVDFNAVTGNRLVTGIYTTTFDVSAFAGKVINLDFWVGDENDVNYDSALFVDNLKISPIADLAITKTVNNKNPAVGEVIKYLLKVTNNGPDTATKIKVTDTLPSGVNYLSAVASKGYYNSKTGVWTIGTLLNGQTATLSLKAVVKKTGEIVNKANVSAMVYDPNLANNAANVTVNAVTGTIPMQATGIPINLAILGILMAIGGVLYPRIRR